MSTQFYTIIPFARVALGDLDLSDPTYSDDTILMVLRVSTGFLALLGYNKGYTSDYNTVSADLSDLEKALYGKATAVLLRHPKAMESAVSGVSVRTEEVSYDTSVNAGMIRDITEADLADLRTLILQVGGMGDGIVGRRPDYGLQLGLDSPYYGTDTVSD